MRKPRVINKYKENPKPKAVLIVMKFVINLNYMLKDNLLMKRLKKTLKEKILFVVVNL